MKRSEMIEQLAKIYATRPEGCSDYHIVDMLLYAAEKRGMLPPELKDSGWYLKSNGEEVYGVYEWEEEYED